MYVSASCCLRFAPLETFGIPDALLRGLFSYRLTGQIIGLREGMLKMLFAIETQKLLGVHIIGEGATELVHIGQAVISLGGTLDYFVQTVFNYPTLAEAYKVAALDAYNRMTF